MADKKKEVIVSDGEHMLVNMGALCVLVTGVFYSMTLVGVFPPYFSFVPMVVFVIWVLFQFLVNAGHGVAMALEYEEEQEARQEEEAFNAKVAAIAQQLRQTNNVCVQKSARNISFTVTPSKSEDGTKVLSQWSSEMMLGRNKITITKYECGDVAYLLEVGGRFVSDFNEQDTSILIACRAEKEQGDLECHLSKPGRCMVNLDAGVFLFPEWSPKVRAEAIVRVVRMMKK